MSRPSPSAQEVLIRLRAEHAEPAKVPYRVTPFDSLMLGLCAVAALGLVTLPAWSLLA